jgi:hypothetical protein
VEEDRLGKAESKRFAQNLGDLHRLLGGGGSSGQKASCLVHPLSYQYGNVFPCTSHSSFPGMIFEIQKRRGALPPWIDAGT